MSAPILLPGDWVYLKVSLNTRHLPRYVNGIRQTPEEIGSAGETRVGAQAQEAVRAFNAMGVYVVSTWQSWGEDVTSGIEVVAVFRNGVTPVNGRAPGL